MAPLKRHALCRLLGFNSWTAVQAWLVEVADEAWDELKDDYLLPFAELGVQHPPGTQVTKDILVQSADSLDVMGEMCKRELMEGTESDLGKAHWNTEMHYARFIALALAADKIDAAIRPEKYHVSTTIWAMDRGTLYGNMYELTETLCHNFWKTAETEFWDSDDTDVPYSNGEDVPGFPFH